MTKPNAVRRRFRLPGFTNMRIGSKLALILLIPLVALAGVVAIRLVDSSVEASRIGDTAEVADLTITVYETIHALQTERHHMAVQLFGLERNLDEDQRDIRHFNDAQDETDTHLEDLASARESFTADAQMLEQLSEADKSLSRLDLVRQQMSNRKAVYLTVYDSAVDRLTRVLDRAVDLADTAELSRFIRAAGLLVSADESSEQLRILVLQLPDGKPLAANYRPFMTLSISRAQSMQEYRRVGGEAVFKAGGLGGGKARPANVLESTIATSRTDEDATLKHDELMGSYDARHEATEDEVTSTLTTARDQARSIRNDVLWQVRIETGLVLIVVALAVMATLGLGRPVIRGLRRLRDSARRIAYEELPAAVSQVGEQRGLQGLSPQEFADHTAAPMQPQGAAELIEVGKAFDDVHHEAIRVAAEQALLRVHIGSMFVQLARRGNSLTGRLTATLDEAERDEQDPNRLQLLFRLDHLVALLGRANDSLLVLGGASAARVRTSDEKLGDVLTAAQSHTEHYTRINIGTVDEGMRVAAEAVEDVVQILAELMDNATRFSRHPAQVIARFLNDRAVIQIRDFGIGIDTDRMNRFNERLSSRSPLDLEALQSMGLTVVGQLGWRHGVEVRLQPAPEGGTTAEVMLPGTILRFGYEDQQQSDDRPGSGGQQAPLFGAEARPHQPAQDNGASLPVIQFEWQTVHADRSLRAGAAMPGNENVSIDHATGLPRRQPQARLVPGAVAPTSDRPDAPAQRDPDAIGATYSAFARGLFGDAAGS